MRSPSRSRGQRVPLTLGCGSGNRRLAGIDADAQALSLHRRIEDARPRTTGHHASAARTLLARGSSTRDEWKRRVVGLGEEAASYRASAVPIDEVWNVLVDPQETTEVRAAAALAVRHHLDDAGRARRVRIAATPWPTRRCDDVFLAVDAGDEAELEGALETIAPQRSRL